VQGTSAALVCNSSWRRYASQASVPPSDRRRECREADVGEDGERGRPEGLRYVPR
jgi:hypothetical protein